MDCSLVMESMDSLWFFSNACSSTSRTEILGAASDECLYTTPVKHVEEPVNEGSSKPMSPIAQNQQKESPLEGGNWGPRCPKCSELATDESDEPEIVKQPVAMEVVEYFPSPSPSPSPSPWSTEKKRRRSKRNVQRRRRKIFGELELGFDMKGVSGSCWSSWMLEQNCGYNQRFGDQHYSMPSISDNMAMKEHLKSWAYAVASTVR